MRTGIAVITPILTIIGRDLGLSTIQLAWLAAIPVLCFAFTSPLTGWLKRLGSVDRIISISMWVLAIALLLRGSGSVFALFFFTLLMGISTAVLNVMLPSWVKLHSGSHAGVVTGTYVMLMGISAAAALALAAPLAQLTEFSWQLAMLPWGLLAVVTAVWWQLRMRDTQLRDFEQSTGINWSELLRSRKAWQLTLFFGFQSMNAYAAGTWIPTILIDRGYKLAVSGLIVAVISLTTSIAATFVPQLAAKRSDQRLILWLFSAITAVGYLGLMFDSGWRLVAWVLLALTGQSATFPLSLILVVLRSSSADQAQSLSAMMQSIGYLIAATGPLVVGAIFQWFDSWAVGLGFMLGIVLLQSFAAAGAGKAGTV
jgi:MFS transporter, CP family, cyanate transporter